MSRAFQLRGYEVDELIGRGASSEVWRARVRDTGETVALKRLFVADPGHLARGAGEAAKLSVLDHPHLVRLHGFVTTADSAVLVLDLADGGSLASLLALRGRLAPGEVITALAPVGAALAHVHASGIIHGDLTPANILFSGRGSAMLADLGVARLTGDDTQAHSTPAYIDPWVARGGIPTRDGDVFMLAAVALHALTGRPLWDDTDADAALDAARRGRLDTAHARLAAAGLPTSVVEVVGSALDLSPSRRGTAADFALELRHSGTPVAVELAAGRGRAGLRVDRRDPDDGWAVDTGSAGTPPDGPVPPPASQTRPRTAPRGRHAAVPVTAARTPRRERGVESRATRESAAAARVQARIDRSRPDFARPREVDQGDPGGGATGPGRPPPTYEVSRPRPILPRPARGPDLRRVRVHRAALVAAVLVAGAVALAAGWSWRDDGAATVPHGGSALATWSSVLRRLDDTRARAFADRDPALLEKVYRTGPLLDTDRDLLNRIVPRGCGLHGVHTVFRHLRLDPAPGPAPPGPPHTVAIVVGDASLPRSTLRCGDGNARAQAPPVTSTHLRIELVRTSAGVRIGAESAG